MAEGKDRVQWEHTSAILARIVGLFEANISPANMNPYHRLEMKTQAPDGAGFAMIKGALLGGSFR